MTASEFAFLALGLMLGLATGAALIEVLRSRPPAPREVRLTVTPDSVPRRSSTLATAVAPTTFGPARGGPADRGNWDGDPNDDLFAVAPGAIAATITTAGATAMVDASVGTAGGIGTTTVRTPVPSGRVPGDVRPPAPKARPLVGIAIEPEPDPVLAALRATPAAVGVTAAGATVTALQDDGVPRAGSPESDSPSSMGNPTPPGAVPEAVAGPCSEERRIAEERCAVAERLGSQAEAVAANLREAQRSYDDSQTRAARAAERADPRALRAAKETAQHVFRAASSAARSPEAVEAAARAWLQEINKINQSAREAVITLRREQETVNGLVTVIERLSVEADAARINAESAREACLHAREAVATCEEAALRGEVEPHVTAPLPSPETPGPPPEEEGALTAAAMLGEGEPVLFRLLRGERSALLGVVARLAGDDPAERRRWQLQLTELLDAILARAIEACCLDFPIDDPFWAPFTREQSREIAAALASLGYRFDGLGSFSDERLPSQRDLSLAVGFAGLDPMRIRHWPPEAEMAGLFKNVTVAADEYVAASAGSLTLGEMVSMLGLRADGLTDLWNAWGRIRPLLIATD